MKKLSVVISAYNEEKNIEECLESVKNVADEIIVVDNSSSDNTQEIAKKYTPHVFTQKNDPKKIDLQKNFGFSKATGDWILSLDADERVSTELAAEIKSVILEGAKRPIGSSTNDKRDSIASPAQRASLQNDKKISGYWIPRKNIIFGKWIEHTGWFPDPQLRLFQKGMGQYTSEHVHEHISITGTVENLHEFILHKHYNNIGEFIGKMMIYAPNEADNLVANGYTFSYLDSLRFPAKEFISRFFAREGYKDGLHGLILSLLMAFYHLMIFIFLWEKKEYREVNSDAFLHDVKNESIHIGKELLYWFATEGLKAAKGMEKITLKIKRKLSL